MRLIVLERVAGIEPASSAWKAEVIAIIRHPHSELGYLGPAKKWWRGQDSNLRRLSRQIYSLIPLTAREPLHEFFKVGAGRESRTPDLLITSQLLYQLSYAGTPVRWSAFYGII